jgi:pyruvate/2-oxoglutarate dehydrogenase complex dihydrolipoamide acyltransferase (E2) component
MALSVPIPRVNNNDDVVKIVRIPVDVGDAVQAGDLVFEVETEKAVVGIEAERDGYVLAIRCAVGDTVQVGTTALWLGDTQDEAIPEEAAATPAAEAPAGEAAVTAKALLLLRQHNLSASAIPRSGPRLTAADVEAFIAAGGDALEDEPAPESPKRTVPANLPAAATTRPLTPPERGLLSTVAWQRDHAAAAYLEIEYDPRPWDEYAAAFARERRLLFSPLLSLIAYRLVRLAPAHNANGTIVEGAEPSRATYQHVNLGFTVQAGENLYLCVVDLADTLDESAFVARLGELQRRAMAQKLAPVEMRGTTVAFSSMARWGVRRHVPVLAPYTALMIAHAAAPADGRPAVLGATYDHRMLTGFDAARLLQKLANPPKQGD